MKPARLVFVAALAITSCAAPSVAGAPSTPEPRSTPTAGPTGIVAHSSIHPVGRIWHHKADASIAYDWFSYVPKSLAKDKPAFILIGSVEAVVPPNDDYGVAVRNAQGVADYYVSIAEREQYAYLLPVIPRPQTHHVYAVAFDWKVFLPDSDPFVQRPDHKTLQMIDALSGDLRLDGYDVQDKVFIEGFSAAGMFAQRFALLHPDRVQAIAAGQAGGSLILPIATYRKTRLTWPVGIYDFSALTGSDFDEAEYRRIPQLVFIGDLDTKNSTLWGTGELWRTQSQIDILNSFFGSSDPVRLRNQCALMQSLGYEVTFVEYEGVAHAYTSAMRTAVFDFFDKHR